MPWFPKGHIQSMTDHHPPHLWAPSSSPESHPSNIPPFLKLGSFLLFLDYSWWRKWSLFSQVDEAGEGKRLLCLSTRPVTSSKFLLLLVMMSLPHSQGPSHWYLNPYHRLLLCGHSPPALCSYSSLQRIKYAWFLHIKLWQDPRLGHNWQHVGGIIWP